MVNLYDMLGLPFNAKENEIRQHIMQHHAAGTLNEKTIEMAKQWLLVSENRIRYDAELASLLHIDKLKSNKVNAVNEKYTSKNDDRRGKVVLFAVAIFFVLAAFMVITADGDPIVDNSLNTTIKEQLSEADFLYACSNLAEDDIGVGRHSSKIITETVKYRQLPSGKQTTFFDIKSNGNIYIVDCSKEKNGNFLVVTAPRED